jgi:pimeloyl-ACP methyl ester carboxylesterase
VFPVRITRRRVAAAGGLTLIALLGVVGIHDAERELHADFRPRRKKPVLPSDGPLAHAASASIETEAGDVLSAWWLPGTNGAVVVLVHGTGADRSQMLPEAQILAGHGYSVLLFDWPGHGESTGAVSWGRRDKQALEGALAYARDRAATDRVGVFAFSIGTVIAVHVVAERRGVRALALAGAFRTLDDNVRHVFRRWGPLSVWPALFATRLAGFHPSELLPPDAISVLSGCSLLFVSGSADQTVPPSMSRELFRAAPEPKEFLEIAGAAHGDYVRVAGLEYEAHLTRFFDQALAPPLAH